MPPRIASRFYLLTDHMEYNHLIMRAAICTICTYYGGILFYELPDCCIRV